MTVEVVLSNEPIDPAGLLARFSGAWSGEGAIASFVGLVRGEEGAVDALVLESYRSVTLASMHRIAEETADRFALTRCLVVHREGRMVPGDAVVFVAAASGHRRAAFDAADCLMDRLKTEAVFWKCEEGPRGSRWIEPRDDDHESASRWRKRENDA